MEGSAKAEAGTRTWRTATAMLGECSVEALGASFESHSRQVGCESGDHFARLPKKDFGLRSAAVTALESVDRKVAASWMWLDGSER